MPCMNGADFIRASVQGIEEQIVLNARQAEQCIDSIADEAVDDGFNRRLLAIVEQARAALREG